MKPRYKNIKKPVLFSSVAIACALLFTTSISSAQSSSILNPGFESKFNDWNDVDPSAISSLERSGSRSAKISGGTGRFSQLISVDSNTNYILSAYVRGAGTIGVNIAGNDNTKNVSNASDWTKADVAFNTGNQTSVTIFGSYNGAQGRFDDYTLEKVAGSGGGDTGGGSGSNACTSANDLGISNASDNGTNDGNIPGNAIDGSLSTRWSSKGDGKTIKFDLGEIANVQELSAAWYKGDQRVAFFDIQTSINNSSWTTVLAGGRSFMNAGLEAYNIDDSQARYVRIVGMGNSSNAWNSLLEVKIKGCAADTNDTGGGGNNGGGGDTGSLDPNLPPSGNFELVDWNISVPTDENNDGKADTIKEIPLSSGYTNNKFFYTANDGGMVFKVPVKGFKTSANTKYTRVELREMLRRGNTAFSTKGVGKNNWVFGSAPSSDRSAAGGVDGTLTGTLAVNHVTTSGDTGQVGRVIVAQIHANDDEPIRLYYRKLPNNSKGSIYFAHEPRNANDLYFEMIGSRSSSQSDPADGIALNEKFSYEIKTVGNTLTVKIIRPGKADLLESVNMSGSGYDSGGQYMYFKAGAYLQDNTGRDDDYAEVTYYSLSNSHN